MKTFSTAITRPRMWSGVASGTIVARMKTLTASAPASTMQRDERDGVAVVSAEDDRSPRRTRRRRRTASGRRGGGPAGSPAAR